MWTWGSGYQGPLGLGNDSNVDTPTQVPGISGAAEVGHHHTVLVLDVGALLDEVLRGPPLLAAQA